MRSTSELTDVTSSVSITDRRTGRQYAELRDLGFGAVLCLDRGEMSFDEDLPLTVWLRALDTVHMNPQTFSEAVDALDELVHKFGRVLVHCHNGTGRSVAVVAAYLAKTESRRAEHALEQVAALRGGLNAVAKGLRALVLGKT